MTGYTAQEIALIQQIQAAMANPDAPAGSGFSIELMLAVFARIVTLRDFQASQATTNNNLLTRVSTLEVAVALLQISVSLLQSSSATAQEVQDIQSTVTTLQQSLSDTQSDIADIDTTVTNISDRVSALENPSGS